MSILLRKYLGDAPLTVEVMLRTGIGLTLRHRLCPAMAQKCGYDNVEDFKENSQKKFSLVENGILEQDCTRLLLINVS